MLFRSALLAVLALLVGVGCGSSYGGEGSQQLAPTVLSSVLSGTVRASDLSPVPRARIFASERSTGRQIQAVSQEDGSFRLEMPSGVYDLGIDYENDPETATCLFGPIDLGQDLSRDFLLSPTEGRAPGTIFGTISQRTGEPAPDIRVRTRAVSALNADVPADQEARTDADGRFEMTLDTDQDVALDLDVYEANGNLDEFVNLPKRAKPFYVEIAIDELPVEDTTRIDQPPLASNSSDIGSPGSTRFWFRSLGQDRALLEHGRIPASGYKYRWFDLLNEYNLPKEARFTFASLLLNGDTYITVGEGNYWYKYSVEVKVSNESKLPKFWFTDEEGDTYSLLCLTQSSHRVSYNSSKPDIVKIEIKL